MLYMLYKVISGIEKPLNYTTLVAVDFTKAFNHTVAVSKIIYISRPEWSEAVDSFNDQQFLVRSYSKR